jgi:hypothetical protein
MRSGENGFVSHAHTGGVKRSLSGRGEGMKEGCCDLGEMSCGVESFRIRKSGGFHDDELIFLASGIGIRLSFSGQNHALPYSTILSDDGNSIIRAT